MGDKGRRRPAKKPVSHIKRDRKKRRIRPKLAPKLPLEKTNIVLLWIGIVLVVVGFVFLALDYAVPFVVLSVLGYVGFIPAALIYPKRRRPKLEHAPEQYRLQKEAPAEENRPPNT